jgi:nitroreductase
MDFLALVRQRYSVRAYKQDPVEDEKLQMILEAARLAPTAANRQPFRILVIPTAEHRTALQHIYGQRWFLDAPLVLCVCGVEAEAWVRRHDGINYVDVDAAIVMDHIVLAATSLGLGTCWIAAFDPDALHDDLNVPPGMHPVALTPLGYPADSPGPKRRKELSTLVQYGPW